MQLGQIDLNLFMVLDAIHRHRSLTKAAKVLNVTQPAVSNALARLRGVFNDPLFVRSSNGMTPTPLVENMIADVQQALELLEHSCAEGGSFDPLRSVKTFRLSMNDHFEALILPKVAGFLEGPENRIAVECHHTPRREVVQELLAGAIDFALDMAFIADERLSSEPLPSHGFVCVLGGGLQPKGESLTLEEYLDLDHIHVSSRRSGAGHEDVALARVGARRRVKMRVQHFHVAAALIQSSRMCLTLPAGLAQRLSLKSYAPPFPIEPLKCNLFWRKSADEDPASVWMRDILRSALVEEGAIRAA